MLGETHTPSFLSSPAISPPRILRSKPHDQLEDISTDARTIVSNLRLSPPSTHELAMPTKQRPRSHYQTAATRTRQEPHERGKERSISRPQPRTRMLPPQHHQLVTQDEQLNVLGNLRNVDRRRPTATTTRTPGRRKKGPSPDTPKPRPQQRFEPVIVLLEPFPDPAVRRTASPGITRSGGRSRERTRSPRCRSPPAA